MYTVESFKNGYALIVDSDKNFATEFIADSLESGELIALGMNKPDMYQALADHRFSVEASGVEVAGVKIKTDRESQGLISRAFVSLTNDLVPDIDFKAVSAWERIDKANIQPVAKAVAAHVRACFRGERVVQELIEGADTLAEILAVDVTARFDQEYAAAYADVMQPAGA